MIDVRRIPANLSLTYLAVALAMLLQFANSCWAAEPKDEICNAEADFPLGLEDYDTAIALHRKVLMAHDDNALAHYHLGFAYGMTGHPTAEVREYLAAARLGLHEWDLFLNLGIAYLGQQDWPNAINALRTAVSLGPEHPEAHFNLAIAYERDAAFAQARQEVVVSLSLNPSDVDASNTKAIICAEQGDLACARDEWTHLVQASPDYAPARINLGILESSHPRLTGVKSASLNRADIVFAR